MNDQSRITFGMVIVVASGMAMFVKGVVLSGMFMGIMSSIAIWVLVMRFPIWLQQVMGRYVLISDLILSSFGASVVAVVGPGPTVFMATVTQMVVLSLLLQSLKPPLT